MTNNIRFGGFIILIVAGLNGCATHTGNGALAGGGLGAVTGALIGAAGGDAASGAAIGAGVGAAAGGLIGASHDEADKRHRERLAAAQSAMSVSDVVYMARSGVGDDTIIAQIRSSRSWFQLTSADIVELRQQGVSERVIQTMLAATRRPRAVVYGPPPVYVVEPAPPPVSIGFGYYHHHHCRPRRCW